MSQTQKRIKILEVGLRDGIQNEKTHFNVKDRYFILKQLIQAGIHHIEIGSFVSKKAVPSMRLTKPFAKKINQKIDDLKKISKKIKLYALVPNEYGLHLALELGLKNISIMASATESFSKKNTNCSIKENLKRVRDICRVARKHRVKINGYLSMAFFCPYEGRVLPRKVMPIMKQLKNEGVMEIAFSDTVGKATPRNIESLLIQAQKYISLSDIRLHCHNTNQMALLNIKKGLQLGVYQFDSSIAGLGGCPYSPGSAGNVATEDVIHFLQKIGHCKNVNLNQLCKLQKWITNKINQTVKNKI